MKYVKMFGLAAAVALALALVVGNGSASATVLCSTTADPCPAGQSWPAGTILDFSVPSGGSLNTTETGGETITACSTSTMKAKISNAGSSTATVTAQIEETTWGGCAFPTTTIKRGGLEIHKIAGTSNGTVTADGISETTSNTVFFGSCIYGVESGKSLGDITEGKPAIIHVNAITTKRSGSAIACPETSRWTGTYTLTSPSATTLSVSSS